MLLARLPGRRSGPSESPPLEALKTREIAEVDRNASGRRSHGPRLGMSIPSCTLPFQSSSPSCFSFSTFGPAKSSYKGFLEEVGGVVRLRSGVQVAR